MKSAHNSFSLTETFEQEGSVKSRSAPLQKVFVLVQTARFGLVQTESSNSCTARRGRPYHSQSLRPRNEYPCLVRGGCRKGGGILTRLVYLPKEIGLQISGDDNSLWAIHWFWEGRRASRREPTCPRPHFSFNFWPPVKTAGTHWQTWKSI